MPCHPERSTTWHFNWHPNQQRHGIRDLVCAVPRVETVARIVVQRECLNGNEDSRVEPCLDFDVHTRIVQDGKSKQRKHCEGTKHGSNKVKTCGWPQEGARVVGRKSGHRVGTQCWEQLSRHDKSTETNQGATPIGLAVEVGLNGTS